MVRSDRAVAAVEGLAGFRCPHCGEVEFDTDSAKRFADAGRSVVALARQKDGQELRRIREKLHLRQADAEKLTGGGHNALSRWERGELQTPRGVRNLFRLLDRDPSRLAELRAMDEEEGSRIQAG